MNWFADMLKTLARGIAALSPSCRQASRLQSETLERKLSASQRLGLRIHLLVCKWCRRYGAQVRFLHEAAHKHPEEVLEPASQKLPDAARERIRQRLRDNESK
jgi:hypothetical protein